VATRLLQAVWFRNVLTVSSCRRFDDGMKTQVFVAIFSFVLVCTGLPAETKHADERAVRDADAEWSKVAGAKDLDKTVSYYADDAVVLPPNQPMVTSRDGIRNLWKGFLDSLKDISWKTTRVETSKPGNMAYLIGTYATTMKDGTKDTGKYCEVWKKQADGKWKVVADMFSSDSPAATSSPAAGAAEKK
jgi:uncharacterized protein (TIGR02246 family)